MLSASHAILKNKDIYILTYNAGYSVENEPAFRRNTSSPSSGSKNSPRKKQALKQVTTVAENLKYEVNVLGVLSQLILYSCSDIKLKLNSVALVRKRTIPTERPPLVGEVSANFLRVEGVAWSVQRIPTAVNLGFLDRSRYFFIQVAPHLSSRG
jgi:hypothetical protein